MFISAAWEEVGDLGRVADGVEGHPRRHQRVVDGGFDLSKQNRPAPKSLVIFHPEMREIFYYSGTRFVRQPVGWVHFNFSWQPLEVPHSDTE